MTHVPGNAYTRRDPAIRDSHAIEAWELVEDHDGEPRVIARAQVTRDDGSVWITGGHLTAGQANVFGQLLEGLAVEAAESFRVSPDVFDRSKMPPGGYWSEADRRWYGVETVVLTREQHDRLVSAAAGQLTARLHRGTGGDMLQA